jgi:hypothetical protein
MKTTLHLTLCLLISSFASCVRVPSATITDTYIEIVKPGQSLGLVEVAASKIDSSFGYPIGEREIVAYTIVDRKTHKMIAPDASVKMYFSKKHSKYCWEISPDIFSADVYYSDTITIKPYTWYRLGTEKYKFSVYFFLDEAKGVYMTKFKPDSGAY